MANDLDDLDGAEGGAQPAEAASWSSTHPRDNQTLPIGVTVGLKSATTPEGGTVALAVSAER